MELSEQSNFKMKKITRGITALFLATTMLACSSDDDNNTASNSEGDLVGTWYLESQSLNGDDLEVNDCQMNENVKFESNGDITYTYYTYFSADCNIDAIERGNWVKNGNDLTISWDEADAGLETMNIDILELSDSTLRWRENLGSEGTLEAEYSK